MGPDETVALFSSWVVPTRTFIIDLYYSGIITFVAALAAVVGALIALKQARTAVRARHGQTFMSIMQYANTIKFTDHLNKIRSLTADELIEGHEEHILPVG